MTNSKHIDEHNHDTAAAETEQAIRFLHARRHNYTAADAARLAEMSKAHEERYMREMFRADAERMREEIRIFIGVCIFIVVACGAVCTSSLLWK